MWLGSGVAEAVVQASSYSSDWTPIGNFHMPWGSSHRKDKKDEKKKKKEKRKQNLLSFGGRKPHPWRVEFPRPGMEPGPLQ